jgi:hypothetical protein
MTEADWLACTNPQKILAFLRGMASERKLRLFSLASCAALLSWTDDPIRNSLWEAASRFVDDQSNRSELDEAKENLFRQYLGPWYDSGPRTWQTIEAIAFKQNAAAAVFCASGGSVGQQEYDWDDFIDNANETIECLYWAARENERAEFTWMKESAAHLLRCIFGPLPFRTVTLDPAIRTWNDATVVRLAQAAHDERQMPAGTLDNGRLAILADALEEAGCTDADILNHLRRPGPHVRGCWVVDAILGKT